MSLVPQAIYDQHIIILGKTRSGKSSVARYMVEHLLDKGEPVCIVDPKGDWWGLKSSADGKRPGYGVVIFGGEHGDVPLNPLSGAAVAELAATENRPCIIDLGGWMPAERTRFWIEFASKYFILSRGRRWLVVDEVHNFCPKGKIMDPNSAKMLHWSNRLASEGLGKGINLIAASQRPQKVHNDFLTSCETLVAMRVVHKADRGAFEDWIDGCGDPEKGGEVVNTLASMKRGEAWVWSPEAEFGPKRIQFPLFSTYDSFRPQSSHEHATKLKGWADVDLAEVAKKLDVYIKKAEENDPEKLKAKIRALELAAGKAVPVSNTAELNSIREERDNLREIVLDFREFLANSRYMMVKGLDALENEAIKSLKFVTDNMSHWIDDINKVAPKKIPSAGIQLKESLSTSTDNGRESQRTASVPARHPRSDVTIMLGEDKATRYQVDILAAFGKLFDLGRVEVPDTFLAAVAGKSITSSTWDMSIKKLRDAGAIEGSDGTFRLTQSGRSIAPLSGIPLTSAEVQAGLRRVLSSYESCVFDAALEMGGETTTLEDLAKVSGKSRTSSSFDAAVASLVSIGALERTAPGTVKAAPWLYLVNV